METTLIFVFTETYYGKWNYTFLNDNRKLSVFFTITGIVSTEQTNTTKSTDMWAICIS